MPCDLGLTRPRTRILLGVSSVGECKASHASLCRSSAFNDPDIMPSDSSPESKLTSVPLILGEPSRRRVASVLCFRTVKRSRARWANAGSAAANSLHAVTALKPVHRSWLVLSLLVGISP
jgi:hypothetical protein